MTFQRISQWVCLPVVFMLAACVPTSENPIIVAGEPLADSELLGVWYGSLDEGDDPFILHFTMPENDTGEPIAGGMDVILVMPSTDTQESGGWAVLHAFSAKIANRRFLSFDYRLDNGEPMEADMRGYHLFEYSVAPSGNMQLSAIDEDRLQNLIENGELPGTVNSGQWTTDVRLTASSEQLVRFLKSDASESLFQDQSSTFIRQTLP